MKNFIIKFFSAIRKTENQPLQTSDVKEVKSNIQTVDLNIPVINIIDKSTLLNDSDFQAMVEACTIQLENHVIPLWKRGKWKIVANQPEDVGYPIIITDDPDQAGALGYHTETPGGKIWGRVFVKPVINRGGKFLEGSLSVSSVLSHEIIEAYCDPNVNMWVDTGSGILLAYEAADPVESEYYEIITSKGTKVSVSNFVLPSWFDRMAPQGERFDYLGNVKQQLEVSTGGYVVTLNTSTGKVENVFGSLASEKFHSIRQDPYPASRSARKVRK